MRILLTAKTTKPDEVTLALLNLDGNTSCAVGVRGGATQTEMLSVSSPVGVESEGWEGAKVSVPWQGVETLASAPVIDVSLCEQWVTLPDHARNMWRRFAQQFGRMWPRTNEPKDEAPEDASEAGSASGRADDATASTAAVVSN